MVQKLIKNTDSYCCFKKIKIVNNELELIESGILAKYEKLQINFGQQLNIKYAYKNINL